jgi:hypothetical protein
MMRRFALLTVSLAMIAGQMPAQAFEGTVTADLTMGKDGPMNVKVMIKGDKSVTVMTLGATAGPMSGKEMRMITDRSTGKMTMLLPMEMMGNKGMKMVMDLDKATGDKDAKIEVKALGTSQTIAGHKCDDYDVFDKGKATTRVCVTHELGRFIFPGGGPMGRGDGPPAWARAFGKDAFPLKVSDSDGKPVMTVTGVHKGSVPADAFVIPDGYADMSGMAGRGRGQQ